jgi:hypothetical protein
LQRVPTLAPHAGAGDARSRAITPLLNAGDARSRAITPLLNIDIDYRYLATTDARFRTLAHLVVDGLPKGNLTVSSGYQPHSIVVSLSVRFGVPAPAVMAPPTPPSAP